MTTHTATPTQTATWPPYAAVSASAALVLTAIGTFWSPLASYGPPSSRDLLSWLVVIVPIVAVALTVVFGLVVRRATRENASRRGLVLALVGALSILVFWTGLPAVLAGGAVCCATLSGRTSAVDKVTLALSALIGLAAIWLALAG